MAHTPDHVGPMPGGGTEPYTPASSYDPNWSPGGTSLTLQPDYMPSQTSYDMGYDTPAPTYSLSLPAYTPYTSPTMSGGYSYPGSSFNYNYLDAGLSIPDNVLYRSPGSFYSDVFAGEELSFGSLAASGGMAPVAPEGDETYVPDPEAIEARSYRVSVGEGIELSPIIATKLAESTTELDRLEEQWAKLQEPVTGEQTDADKLIRQDAQNNLRQQIQVEKGKLDDANLGAAQYTKFFNNLDLTEEEAAQINSTNKTPTAQAGAVTDVLLARRKSGLDPEKFPQTYAALDEFEIDLDTHVTSFLQSPSTTASALNGNIKNMDKARNAAVSRDLNEQYPLAVQTKDGSGLTNYRDLLLEPTKAPQVYEDTEGRYRAAEKALGPNHTVTIAAKRDYNQVQQVVEAYREGGQSGGDAMLNRINALAPIKAGMRDLSFLDKQDANGEYVYKAQRDAIMNYYKEGGDPDRAFEYLASDPGVSSVIEASVERATRPGATQADIDRAERDIALAVANPAVLRRIGNIEVATSNPFVRKTMAETRLDWTGIASGATLALALYGATYGKKKDREWEWEMYKKKSQFDLAQQKELAQFRYGLSGGGGGGGSSSPNRGTPSGSVVSSSSFSI